MPLRLSVHQVGGWAVLVCWRMPHFFAIGWLNRADYRAMGLPLLPAIDATGARTASWSFGYAGALMVVSLMPWIYRPGGGDLRRGRSTRGRRLFAVRLAFRRAFR